jgi:hypothetical protein
VAGVLRSPVQVSAQGDKFRGVNVQLFPYGTGLVLAYFPQTQQTTVLSADLAQALRRCQTFRGLEEHAAALREAPPLASDIAKATAMIHKLMSGGALVKAESLWMEAREAAPATISTVGVLTCNRIDGLRAAVSSYEGNFRKYERSPELIVLDDARAPEERLRCRESLRKLSVDLGRPITYVGADQKQRLARALAERTGVDLPTLHFALFDSEGSESIGANRNALALLSAGGLLFSADDDTVCRLFASPDQKPGLVVGAEHDPTEFWFFPSREAALGSSEPQEHDLLGAHERLLGRTLGDLAAWYEGRAQLELGMTCDHVFDAWAAGAARVRTTFAGVVGDSGMYSGRLLRHLTGASRARATLSEAAYEMATTSREVLRVVRSYAVTHGPPYMATTAGFDQRELTPPFFPMGRNEDGIFGMTLRQCAPSAFFGHVPLAIEHAAAPNRRYFDFISAATEPRFCQLLVGLMMAAHPVGNTDEERMRGLGKFLQQVAQLTPSAFVDTVCPIMLTSFGVLIEGIERELAIHARSPIYWARDLTAQRDALSRRLTSGQNYWLPSDFGIGRSPEDAQALTQSLILRFGQLLEAWPVLFAEARALRESSTRFGEPA